MWWSLSRADVAEVSYLDETPPGFTKTNFREELNMKKIAISMLLTSAVAFATAQETSSANGKWKIHSAIAGNESDMECTFSQTDKVLAGKCKGEQGDLKITGKVDGKKVTWSYESDYNGTTLNVKYDGILDSGKITGSVSVEPFGVGGDFTATSSN
jgi:hypothetical protein